MRDDFSQATKDLLANRVGWKCSNPNCRKATRGAGKEKTDVINIGVASHITAASKGGPRYDENMTSQERKSFENGIWLCQSCSKLIDSDVKRYTVDKLKKWKELSEQMAVFELEEVTVNKNDQDKELMKFLVECFSRSAFYDRICQEESDKAIEDGDRLLEDMLVQALDAAQADDLENGLKIAESAMKKAQQKIDSPGMQYSMANAQKTAAQIMLVLHKDLDRALELIDAAIKNSDFNCKPDKFCGALIIKAGIALAAGNVEVAKGAILAAEKMADDESTKCKIMYFKAQIMLECGEAFAAKELLQKCLDFYASQVAACTNEECILFLKVQYAEVLNSMGYLLQQVGNYLDAIDNYKSAIEEIKNTRYLSTIILFDLNYAECLFGMRESEYIKQCLSFLVSIESEVENLNQKHLKKRFYGLKSKVHYYFGDIIESENNIKLALKYTEDAGEKIYYHQILANYVMHDGDSNKMLWHLNEAEKIAIDLEDKTLLYSINEQKNNIGKYVNYRFRKEENGTTLLTRIPSEEGFKDVIKIKEIERLNTKEEKEEALSKSLRELVKNVSKKDGKGSVSQNIINELIKKAENENNPIKKAGIYNEIGHKYCMIGNLVKAKYWQELAYNKVKNTHSIQVKAYALMGLADIALLTHKQPDEEKAKKYIDEVETIISGKPYWEIYARCEMFKVEFEGRGGNYDVAFRHIEEAQKLIKEYKLQMDDEFNYALSCCTSFVKNRLMKAACNEEELENLNEERLWLEGWYPKYKKQLRRYWWYYRGMDVIRNLKGPRKSIGILALENGNAIKLFGEALSTLFSVSAYVVKEDLSLIDNFSTYTLPVPETTPFPFSVSLITEEETEKYGYIKSSDGTDKYYPYVMIKSEEIFDQELDPKPLVLDYAGMDIPNIVYTTPIVTQWKEKSGLWWISSDFKNDENFVQNVLNCAKDLKAIPIFDYKNVDLCNEVEIIRSKRILIPYYDPLIKECEFLEIEQVRSVIRRLTESTNVSKIQAGIDELSKELEHLSAIIKGGTFVDIAILSFPFNVWIDGYTKKTYYPALLLSDSVLIDKETYGLVATKISTIAEIYDEW